MSAAETFPIIGSTKKLQAPVGVPPTNRNLVLHLDELSTVQELRLLYSSDIDIVIVCNAVGGENISTLRQILTLSYGVRALPV